MFLYIGTYTQCQPHVPDARGKGVYLYQLDQETGVITKTSIGPFAAGENPTFLAVTKSGQWLYAISEEDPSSITGFKVDRSTGQLVETGKWPTGGIGGCNVAVTPDDKYVLCANYVSGSAMSFVINHSTGALSPLALQKYAYVSGANPARQDAPHAHCNVPNHDGTRAYVADLGGDRIYKYSIDPQSGALTAPGAAASAAFVATPNGAGPRHIAVHPTGSHMYVIGELSHRVLVYAISGADGELEMQQELETLPPPPQPESAKGGGKVSGPPEYGYCCSADIHLTPDARFLYISNRFVNGIAGFRVDPDTKLLTRLPQHTGTRGKIPRNFLITPNGKLLIVGNQDSHNLVTFKIDQESGDLEFSGHEIDCPSPVCIVPLI